MEIIRSILEGSLLGDGTIRRTKRVRKSRTYFDYCFIKNQAQKDCKGYDKKTYLEFHAQHLLQFHPSIGTVKKKDGQDQYELRTKKNDFFKQMESEWYENRIKRLPRQLKLTPLAVCIWFMDDGSNYPTRRQAEFHTQSFTLTDNERLVELLGDLGVPSKIQEFRGKYHIYVGPNGYLPLIDLIKPFCKWNCFKHKHDLSEYSPQTYARGELNGHSKFTESDAKWIILSSDTNQQLASKYKVHPCTISRIRNGKRWKHLEVCHPKN